MPFLSFILCVSTLLRCHPSFVCGHHSASHTLIACIHYICVVVIYVVLLAPMQTAIHPLSDIHVLQVSLIQTATSLLFVFVSTFLAFSTHLCHLWFVYGLIQPAVHLLPVILHGPHSDSHICSHWICKYPSGLRCTSLSFTVCMWSYSASCTPSPYHSWCACGHHSASLNPCICAPYCVCGWPLFNKSHLFSFSYVFCVPLAACDSDLC